MKTCVLAFVVVVCLAATADAGPLARIGNRIIHPFGGAACGGGSAANSGGYSGPRPLRRLFRGGSCGPNGCG